MNSKPVFLAFLLLTPNGVSAQPEKDWTRLWGGTTNDYGMGVAVDRAGDIFVAGSSEGPIAGQDNSGVTQSCLTKLTSDGKRLWTRLWSGQANNEALDVAVDSVGNVYVTGYTAGPLEGEPTVGRYDLFLSKIASGSEGTRVWTRVWGSTEFDTAYGVAVDSTDHLYVAGYAGGAIDDQVFLGRSDLCLSKFSPEGKRLWTRLAGSSGLDWAQDVVCAADGGVYVVGYTEGSFDQQPNHGGRDACLVRFSSDGERVWSRIFGSSARDEGYGVAVDGLGNAYATGFAGSFNGQTVVGDWRDNDAFLISYDRDGNLRWTRLWGSRSGDVGYGVAIDHARRVYVAGHAPFNEPFDTTAGVGLHSRYTLGVQFLTQFNTDGVKFGSQTWGSTNCSAEAIAWDGGTRLYVAGYAFDGFDGQESTGHNDHCLTSWTIAPAPTISNLRVTGANRWPRFTLAATDGVDRVDYAINGTVFATVYGPPWEFTADPAELVGTLGLSLGANRAAATAFDETGGMVAAAESTWQSWLDGVPTEVRIDAPTSGYTIYTDDVVSPTHTMTIRVYAAYVRFWLEEGPMGGSRMRDRLEPISGGTFQVRVSVDGVLLGSSTEGLEHDPYYHEFEYTSAGLDLGSHRVSAHLIPPEGYSHAWSSAHFTVERRQPDLRVSRDVTRVGNRFDVTLTIRNAGSALARLHWLEETMTGFQGCNPESSMTLNEVSWEYEPTERVCRGRFDFGSAVIPVDGSRTVSYQAVPILFRHDCDYQFGGDGSMGYSDAEGMGRLERLSFTTSQTSPWSSRQSIADAVVTACQASDYLLVTDPVNLANAHGTPGASSILADMAELATLRNGVLGFYHAAGMILSGFRRGDLVGVGQVFRTRDTKEQVFVGRIESDRIACHAETGELTLDDHQLPIQLDLRAGDALAVGNTANRYLQLTNQHTRAEVVVAWGSGHAAGDQGKIFSYQIDYDTNRLDHFEVREFNGGFSTGDQLAVAEVWSNPMHPPFDDIVIADAEGSIRVYTSSGLSLTDFAAAYHAGDLFAVGELIDDGVGGPEVEMVVGDVSADRLKVYVGRQAAAGDIPVYTREAELAVTLETEDGLVLGDVMGDSRDEIVVADASEDRITIYGYAGTGVELEELARFRYDYHADDELAAGYFNARDREQLLVIRGHEVYGRSAGTLEIISHFRGENPGDRWALDDLIDAGGRWADALAPGWTDDGYLLLVGETEIIPTFSKDWDISDWGSAGGRVDYTDRNYASTNSDSDNNRPELAVGRIPGNSVDRICQALRTAIELARNPGRLNNGNAYCVSGSDEDDEHLFVSHRRDIAGRLADRGFSVSQQHAPSASDFAAAALDQDIVFFTPHGSAWGTCGLDAKEIGDLFDPGTARPLVYASSCLTGRYPAGSGTFGEQFLLKGAAAYVGATEVTWHVSSPGIDVCGWGPRFTEAFFARLEAGRTLGRTLTLAKQRRLSGAANTYSWDWNRNRYHCAIYHFLGDPKLEIDYAASRSLRPMDLDDPDEPSPLPGPLSQLELAIPSYQVTPHPAGERVEIPGGGSVWVTGRPEVPSYGGAVHFPAGEIVQDVQLLQRGGERLSSGLKLPPTFVYQGDGEGNPPPQPLGDEEGWWPDRDFDWSLEDQADGSTILAIQAYPFFHNAATTESRFYSNLVFGIAFAKSSVQITRLVTDRQVYPPGAAVAIDLRLRQNDPQPADLRAELTVLNAASTVVAVLPERKLTQLTGRAIVPLSWDSSGHPGGDYELRARVKGPNDLILDRERTEFRVGQAGGGIVGFEVLPPDYRPGDNVVLRATFDNTGNTSLDGSLVVLVQDAAGIGATEFRRQFGPVPAGASFSFDAEWVAASLHPRNCQFLVYAEFDGQATALHTVADWSTAPLEWEWVDVAPDWVELAWWSVAGRHYAIEFTPDLGVTPFETVWDGIAASPPRNTVRLDSTGPSGFYRLSEMR